MAKYKVLVIGISIKNNKVAKFGEIVDESQLCSNPDELVKGKYIERVKESKQESKVNVKETVVKDAEILDFKE